MLNAIWAAMILLAVVYGAVSGHLGEVTNAALDSAGEAVSLCITMAGVVALWMGLMEVAQRAGLIDRLTRGISPFLRFLFPRIPRGHPAEGYIAANVIANVLGLGWACTPAGLKAMEELAKLEAERGNPEYLETENGERDIRDQMQARAASAGKSLKGTGAAKDLTGSGYREKNPRSGTGAAKGLAGSGYREKDPRSGTGAAKGLAGFGYRERNPRSGFGKAGREEKWQTEMTGRGRRASNEMCIFLILNISSLQLIPVNMIAYRSQYGSANPTAVIAPAIAATLVSTLVAIVYCKIKDAAMGSRISGVHSSGYVRDESKVRNSGGKAI